MPQSMVKKKRLSNSKSIHKRIYIYRSVKDDQHDSIMKYCFNLGLSVTNSLKRRCCNFPMATLGVYAHGDGFVLFVFDL
jgi:GH24 family phage-related lysozyme (muramidase)